MKGMALNRAIYVFTAVTVIYTPLGFMAVSTSTLLIKALLTSPAGTMGIAYPEQNSSRRLYPRIDNCSYSLFCCCANFHLHRMWVFGLVLYFNKKLGVIFSTR